jgi:hypothetical protein
MKKQFIATVVAGAIAFTGFSSAPARADQATDFFIGAAAIILLGTAIAQHQKNNRQVTRNVPHKPKRHRKALPARCQRDLWTKNGWKSFYRKRCTQRNVARPGRLPNQCLRNKQTHNGVRAFYKTRCLRKNGWTV